jgi:hypothetical protein
LDKQRTLVRNTSSKNIVYTIIGLTQVAESALTPHSFQRQHVHVSNRAHSSEPRQAEHVKVNNHYVSNLFIALKEVIQSEIVFWK